MTAEGIAAALGGRKVGQGWMARCPAHDDRNASLSIRDGNDRRPLVHCHGGCAQEPVIAALRARGLWPGNPSRQTSRFGRRQAVDRKPDQYDARRGEAAMGIWRAAKPAQGSLVEVYLASRGIRLPPPDALRFHADLKHPSGGVWPAMVALVTNGVDGAPVAIHRTFLSRDGRAKAPIVPAKMMLGPCSGAAVRLTEPSEVLMVGEGIETCVAAMQATGLPAWAALSTSGLRALDLPKAVRQVIVLADGDNPGEEAACRCARRWKDEGRRVRIARPPRGMDFNDLLLGRAPRTEEGAQ